MSIVFRDRDPDAFDGVESVVDARKDLKEAQYIFYGDDALNAVAIVSLREGEVLVMTQLLASHHDALCKVMDITAMFKAIQ